MLLYSARLSRRIVTRPGSPWLGAIDLREGRVDPAGERLDLLGFGCGLSSGGISPDSTYSLTRPQSFRARTTAASSANAAKFRSAFGFAPP